MPAQVGQSEFLLKMGQKVSAAFDKHKNDALKDIGGGEIPPGVEGVARLVSVKLDKVAQGKQNAGQWYLNAQAVAVTPDYFTDSRNNRVKVAGKRTSYMEMLCDTPPAPGSKVYDNGVYTLEDHIARAMQWFRRLGCKVEVVPAGQGAMFIEKFVADLNARTKPPAPPLYVEYRTYVIKDDDDKKPKVPGQEPPKEKRTNHIWGSAVAYKPQSSSSPDAAFVDHTNKVGAASNGKSSTPSAPTGGTNRIATKAEDIPVTNDPEPPEGQYDESMGQEPEPTEEGGGEGNEAPVDEPSAAYDATTDLDALAELADGGDKDASSTLTNMARKQGIKDDAIKNADSWAEVATLIAQGGQEAPAEEPTEEHKEPWKVGDVANYKAGKATKATAYKIESVNAEKGTCSLKSMTSGAVVKNVPLDKLEEVS